MIIVQKNRIDGNVALVDLCVDHHKQKISKSYEAQWIFFVCGHQLYEVVN